MKAATLLILGAALALSGVSLYNAWAQTIAHYPGSSYFPDVTPGTSYDHNIGYAHEYGVVNGFPDGTYGPSLAVTRQQMPTFIMRQSALDATMSCMIVDDLYFGGYYFGWTAYQEGRISYEDYQQFQALLDWYADMMLYQASTMSSPQPSGTHAAAVAAARRMARERVDTGAQ
jgi:hypothetical protein